MSDRPWVVKLNNGEELSFPDPKAWLEWYCAWGKADMVRLWTPEVMYRDLDASVGIEVLEATPSSGVTG